LYNRHRQNATSGLLAASRILVLCIIHSSYAVADEPRPAKRLANPTTKIGSREAPAGHGQGGHARVRDLRFAHLTTDHGLSQNNVVDILQDRRGFMWFATGDGLNRYDGNGFTIYKNNPTDPRSISDNFVRDLHEDAQGYLWVAAYPGVNKFDPTTERSTRYVHDPNNPKTLSGDSVESIARDSRGYLWFGTSENGLDRFDPATETFTHYRDDSDGQFVGRITHVIEDSHREIWFVGERGLFHVNSQTGRITRRPAGMNRLSADYVYEDNAGNFWMLAWSPIVGLVKYDRQSERLIKYALPAGATGLPSSKLLDDGENGFWVPSSLGLYYFDRSTERLRRLFEHDETDPDSLNDNTVVSIYRDRSGLLWVGTGNGGLNILNLQERQFGHYRHRPASPYSLSPGRVTAIHQEPNGVLWIGFYPRALDRLDRKTGRITHYVPGLNTNGLSKGGDINSIYKDSRGYLWLGGWAGGLDRFDERTGQFKHYRHDPHNPNSLMSDNVLSIYEDRSGRLWVGQFGGLGSFDPATDGFTNYPPNPNDVARLAYSVSAMHQDRSGTFWLGMLSGMLSRFDYRTSTFVTYKPDLHDPRKLQGGSIGGIREDRTGTLWLASGRGLYRYNRHDETFARFTEGDGLPSNDIMGILEDDAGRLWLSTKKGMSRFDRKTERFRNYDVSDGLLTNEFSRSCFQQGENGEMLFCGNSGITMFFPESVRDNPYVPPVVITNFRIFNDPVPIGADSVLKKAIPYTTSLVLSHRDYVFSFEFAALSYANSQKNRYRYKLENFDRAWNDVRSRQRLATYTNLDPGDYIFRVQGSNSDGVWNEEGVLLPIVITPPWYKENWFRVLSAAFFLALLWAAYQFRMWQLQLDVKKLRDVIDTIPAMAWTARPDGSNAFVNRRWAEYTGLSAEDTAGSGWAAAVHAEDRQPYGEKWRASLATGEPFECEARFRSAANGEYRWLLARGVPVRDNHGKIIRWYGILTDIEARKRAEEQRERFEADLAHINRVSVMGELAASIAHEVNQPLSGIVSNGSACLRWLARDVPDVAEVREAIGDIVRDGKRAGEVIARIRALTKRTITSRDQLDLNETIREVLVLVGDQARRNRVVVQTQFAPDASPVAGDRVQLQQVVLNLIMNAIEAMSGVSEWARELVVMTRNLGPEQVEVTVEDSGTGIDPEKIDKIFDSFYTTKSSGMGMGLSISRSILEAHGGRLWATAKDRGTTFHFTLPKYHEEGSDAEFGAV
jgi:PAS domain S-box-containing protein